MANWMDAFKSTSTSNLLKKYLTPQQNTISGGPVTPTASVAPVAQTTDTTTSGPPVAPPSDLKQALLEYSGNKSESPLGSLMAGWGEAARSDLDKLKSGETSFMDFLNPEKLQSIEYMRGIPTVPKLEEQQKTFEGDTENYFYDEAVKAAKAAQEADVNRYNELVPLSRNKLMGSLNARGLGTSVMGGGQGTGALSSLAQRLSSGLGDINLGYQDLLQNLAAQHKAGEYNISDFYRNMELAKQKSKEGEAGVLDYLGGLINAGSAYLPGALYKGA